MSYNPTFRGSAILDGSFSIENTADITKKLIFDASNIGTGQTRTLVMPNFNVNLGTLTTGPLTPALGTAGAPAYSFTGDTNTGLFSPGADILGLSVGGNELLRIAITDDSGNGVVDNASLRLESPFSNTVSYFTADGGIWLRTLAAGGTFLQIQPFATDGSEFNGINILGHWDPVAPNTGGREFLTMYWSPASLDNAFVIDTEFYNGTQRPLILRSTDSTGTLNANQIVINTDGSVTFGEGLGVFKKGTQFTQIATPSNPPAGSNKLYFKSGDHLYMKNSAGVETQVDGGGGGGSLLIDGSNSPTATIDWNAHGLLNLTLLTFKTGIVPNNIAIGTFASTQPGSSLTTGDANIMIGTSAGSAITSGDRSVVIGYEAGLNLADGSSNIFIGHQAGRLDVSGFFNVCIGETAGKVIQSNYNTLVGALAGLIMTSGQQNTGIGVSALQSLVTGSFNTALGVDAGFALLGDRNTCVGSEAGAGATGNRNSFFGQNSANGATSGNDNISIGYNSALSGPTVSNELAIGTFVTGNATSVIIGGARNLFVGDSTTMDYDAVTVGASIVQVAHNWNSDTAITVYNPNSSGAASSGFLSIQDSATHKLGGYFYINSGYSGGLPQRANQMFLFADTGAAGGMALNTYAASAPIRFQTNSLERGIFTDTYFQSQNKVFIGTDLTDHAGTSSLVINNNVDSFNAVSQYNTSGGTSAFSTYVMGEDEGTLKFWQWSYLNSGISISAPYAASQGVIQSRTGATGGIMLLTQAGPIKFAASSALVAQVNAGNVTFYGDILFNSRINGHRVSVADTNYTVLITDFIVAFTSLTASRNATLPAPTSDLNGWVFLIKDESGTAGTNNIVLVGTVDGGSVSITANYGVARIYCNGTAYFTF